MQNLKFRSRRGAALIAFLFVFLATSFVIVNQCHSEATIISSSHNATYIEIELNGIKDPSNSMMQTCAGMVIIFLIFGRKASLDKVVQQFYLRKYLQPKKIQFSHGYMNLFFTKIPCRLEVFRV